MGVMVRDTHTHTHFTLVSKYLNKATLKWLLPRETRWLLLTPASQWALRLSLDKDACISVVHAGAGTSTCAGGTAFVARETSHLPGHAQGPAGGKAACATGHSCRH